MTASAAWLPDGRLHLHHGPIDLILDVEGPGRKAALQCAVRRFQLLLDELVAELPQLRQPAGPPLKGAVARRMADAIAPFAPTFITPMAAVAGAVADEILTDIRNAPGVIKAHVNNGGDIAFHLEPGQTLTALIATDPPARIALTAGNGIAGIATSGWRGRSQSLGIADSVTVLARTAATADAAATLIANAVDLPGHPAIRRQRANEVFPDSDLGRRRVTIDVAPLSKLEIRRALQRGRACAETFLDRGLILGAALTLQGILQICGNMPQLE